MEETKKHVSKLKGILLPVVFTIISAAFSAIWTNTESEWYQSLMFPAFQPPSIVFSIVWPIFFIGLAFVGIMLYRKQSGYFYLWCFHLALLPLWNYTFFYRMNIMGAFVFLLLLWATTVILFMQSWKQSSLYLIFFIPYIMWLTFASVLNYTVALLN